MTYDPEARKRCQQWASEVMGNVTSPGPLDKYFVNLHPDPISDGINELPRRLVHDVLCETKWGQQRWGGAQPDLETSESENDRGFQDYQSTYEGFKKLISPFGGTLPFL